MSDINYAPLIEDMSWSYSRIKSYQQCPMQWKLNYINGFSKEKMFYSEYGSLMHRIIEKYYKGDIEKEEMPVEFLIGFSTGIESRNVSPNVLSSYLNNSLEYLKNFKEFGLETIDIEKKFKFHFERDEKIYRFVGILDYIGQDGDDIYIIDNKSHDLKPRSNKAKPTTKDAELDDYLKQLYIYSTPIKNIYGKFPKYLCFNCFRNGTFIKEEFHEDKYYEAVDWALDVIETIKNDSDFDANYDWFYCKNLCDMHNHCEDWRDY